MSASIQVTNPNYANIRWGKIGLSSEEFVQLENLCKGKPTIDLFSATLKPVRTDNWENFSKDFFLPTVMNHAIKVQHAVGKVFAILASLILDLVTFPIRLITCIPRVMANAKKEEHPLYQYLKAERVNPEVFDSDHVLVKIEKKTVTARGGWEIPGESIGSKKVESLFSKKMPVNFVELPEYYGWNAYRKRVSGVESSTRTDSTHTTKL